MPGGAPPFDIVWTMASTSDRILGLLRSLAGSFFKPRGNAARPGGRPGARGPSRPAARPASSGTTPGPSSPYPGDFRGTSRAVYAPKICCRTNA